MSGACSNDCVMGWEWQAEPCSGHSSGPAPAALLHIGPWLHVPFAGWGAVALDVSHVQTQLCVGLGGTDFWRVHCSGLGDQESLGRSLRPASCKRAVGFNPK